MADFVSETLGSKRGADRGFDLEIWNELTFGSSFLCINNYFDPKLVEYKEEAIWEGLVRETAELAERQPDRFRGVTLVDGFRNTIPWPASSREPACVGGLSAHPYPVRKAYPKDEAQGPSVNALFAQEESPTFTHPSTRPCFPSITRPHFRLRR